MWTDMVNFESVDTLQNMQDEKQIFKTKTKVASSFFNHIL